MEEIIKDKGFTTFEQQIKILKGRNLKFVSEETALNSLRRDGYYSIINGYKDPYVEIIDGKEEYKEGITFEQIYSLFSLDKQVRSRLMDSMLEFESNLRTAVAHTLGESFTADQTSYLSRKNFRLGKQRANGQYQLDDILTKFNKILLDDVQPIKHYRETYKNVPPWILLKGASFGNLVNFVKLLKPTEKERVISLMYDIPISIVNANDELKNLFMDTLFVCLDYRNRAAHGGRIYNYKSDSKFRYNKLLHNELNISPADCRVGNGDTGLVPLLGALKLIDNRNPFITLRVAFELFLEEHCDIYPEDKTYLEQYIKLL